MALSFRSFMRLECAMATTKALAIHKLSLFIMLTSDLFIHAHSATTSIASWLLDVYRVLHLHVVNTLMMLSLISPPSSNIFSFELRILLNELTILSMSRSTMLNVNKWSIVCTSQSISNHIFANHAFRITP